jgi:hypothetical protein
MLYIQKIFNTQTNSYVYYSSTSITSTPDIETTSPETLDEDDLVSSSHSLVAVLGGSGVTILDEGTPLTSAVNSIDFLGGVASAIGDNVTITDSGGGGPTIPPLSGVNNAFLAESPIGTLVWKPISAGVVVPLFDIASFSKTAPDGGTLLYRRGDTLTGITSSATYVSGPPTSASIANAFGGSTDGGDVNPGVWTITTPFATASLAGSVKRNGSDLGADPVMTVTLEATNEIVDTANFTIQWTRDVYYGVGVAGINTESGIEALAGTALATTRIRNITVSPSNQKVYYAYPKAYGTATFTLDNFPAGFNAPIEVSLTNINSVTSTYYVYESTNLLTGTAQTFVVT